MLPDDIGDVQLARASGANNRDGDIECSQEVLDELESAFRFNDAVLRHLTLTCKSAETEKSFMMKEVEREESAKTVDRKPAASTENAAQATAAVEAVDVPEAAEDVVPEPVAETSDNEVETAVVEEEEK